MAGLASAAFDDARVFFRRCLDHTREDAIDYLFYTMARAYVQTHSYVYFAKPFHLHSHLWIAETLSNIYSKADQVLNKDEQDFAEYAFLGVGFLVRIHPTLSTLWNDRHYYPRRSIITGSKRTML